MSAHWQHDLFTASLSPIRDTVIDKSLWRKRHFPSSYLRRGLFISKALYISQECVNINLVENSFTTLLLPLKKSPQERQREALKWCS